MKPGLDCAGANVRPGIGALAGVGSRRSPGRKRHGARASTRRGVKQESPFLRWAEARARVARVSLRRSASGSSPATGGLRTAADEPSVRCWANTPLHQGPTEGPFGERQGPSAGHTAPAADPPVQSSGPHLRGPEAGHLPRDPTSLRSRPAATSRSAHHPHASRRNEGRLAQFGMPRIGLRGFGAKR